MIAGILVSGSIYAMIALGFALSFRMSGVFNISYGGLLVLSAYINYLFISEFHFRFWASMPFSILIITGLALVVDVYLIPKAKTILSSVDILIVSWLFLLVIQNGLTVFFSSKSIYLGVANTNIISLLGGTFTLLQVFTVFLALLLGAAIYLLGRHTLSGHAIIAVGDDPWLAKVCGLNTKKILAVNAIAMGVLTGFAGILISYQERVDPSLGFRFSIIAIVCTLIGSKFGAAGAVVGALFLAALESMVLYLIDPGLRDTAVYGLLFVAALLAYQKSTVSDTP